MNFPPLNQARHPQNLHHNAKNTEVLSSLLDCVAFICLAGFGSTAFSMWAPSLFCYYATYLCNLLLHDATLVMNWANSIFTCITFNFGLLMLCFCHTDSGNLSFSWCAITALSKFNYCCGGHLILWDLKLVINFPPGSTILIPSAILQHSNTSLTHGEWCYSFTQYTLGALFCWVDYRFQSSKSYWASLATDQWEKATQEREERWRLGLSLFSTLEKLQAM
ncbi:hypothetical protein EV421DRAFT_1889158 [Armillaria borealis]|uniref:Uncharacterized protein n=1 Tax=Armillaria borealis TaxID=47425 RepID=A0AA39MXD6_9AGAR|nr:hypothetical protein EV421DRAFT_1889158 [Armillaria borealis]